MLNGRRRSARLHPELAVLDPGLVAPNTVRPRASQHLRSRRENDPCRAPDVDQVHVSGVDQVRASNSSNTPVLDVAEPEADQMQECRLQFELHKCKPDQERRAAGLARSFLTSSALNVLILALLGYALKALALITFGVAHLVLSIVWPGWRRSAYAWAVTIFLLLCTLYEPAYILQADWPQWLWRVSCHTIDPSVFGPLVTMDLSATLLHRIVFFLAVFGLGSMLVFMSIRVLVRSGIASRILTVLALYCLWLVVQANVDALRALFVLTCVFFVRYRPNGFKVDVSIVHE